MSDKEGESISSSQETHTNTANAEMTCLLTGNDEDNGSPSSPNNDEKMSGYPYNNNGEGSSYPRRDHRDLRAGVPPGDVSQYGSFPSNSNYPEQHGMFGMPPPSMPPTGLYSPTPFGASPPSLFTGPRGRANSTLTSQDRVLLSAISPGPIWPTNDQLDVAYGYGIRREDGAFTRLIRADRLPLQLAHLIISERQGPEGLIIVPEPRQPSPTRRSGAMPLVPGDVVARLPIYNPNGPQFGSPGSAGSAQLNIDAIIAQSSSISPTNTRPYNPRRQKIYCDKWIHEGVCAFTQMGCKYKHEMPLDKATQISLGLNHGLPTWYRRAQAVNVVPTGALNSPPAAGAAPIAMTSNPGRIAGNWRRIEGAPGAPSGPGGMAPAGLPGASGGSFGPIGPPTSHNSYAALKLEEGEVEEDEDEDEVTYRGRGDRRR